MVGPQDLLDEALAAETYSPEAILLTGAAVALITGVEVVIVGGAAVNCYVGTYVPTDVDVVGPVGNDDLARLKAYGFQRRGRHYVLERAGKRIDVEVPSSKLEGDEPPQQVEVAEGVYASLIALNDLVMDRLRQATDGTDVMFEEAVRLAIGAYERIDWDSIHERVARAGRDDLPQLPDALRRVQREAKKRLRSLAQQGQEQPGAV